MSEKHGLVIADGGSWNAFGAGILARLNINYDVIYGMGTGALLAPMVALKEWDIIKYGFLNLRNSDMFDAHFFRLRPIGKNGRIRKIPIIYSILTGNKTIGTTNNIRKTMDTFFKEEYFIKLREENKEIIVVAQNLAQIPPKTHLFSSSTNKYNEFKDWMWCAANFPFYGSIVKKGWYDSNGKFHIGKWSGSALINLAAFEEATLKQFTDVDIILHRPRFEEKYEGNKINSLIDHVITALNGLKYDIEYEYFYTTIRALNRRGVRVRAFWLPRKLSNNYMCYKPKEMLQWWNEGYETAFNEENIDIFEPVKPRF